MLIKEFRIPLPLTVEEYQVAQLYAVAEASKGETGGGEGVEVLVNEPYEDKEKDEKGQYTHKIYHLRSKVPSYIRALAPKGALEIHEKAWNAYPYCKTVLSNPDYMGDKFMIEIITLHKPDLGTQDNVHDLEKAELEKRAVVHIDIAAKVDAKDYKKEEDPRLFKSTETGRGPLLDNWLKELEGNTNTPRMCCYKLVRAEFKWFGLQGNVENFIQKIEKRLFTNFHRKLFCSMDEWYGKSMEDIRAIEEQTKKELDEMRKSGEVKGTKDDK